MDSWFLIFGKKPKYRDFLSISSLQVLGAALGDDCVNGWIHGGFSFLKKNKISRLCTAVLFYFITASSWCCACLVTIAWSPIYLFICLLLLGGIILSRGATDSRVTLGGVLGSVWRLAAQIVSPLRSAQIGSTNQHMRQASRIYMVVP